MLPYILAAVGGYLIGDSMKGKQYAYGGKVDYVANDPYDQKYFRRFNDAIGSFGWMYGKNYNEGILYPLESFDKEYYSHIELKKDEVLLRYRTDRMVKEAKYLIKINLDKALIYFMSDSDSDDDKNPKFETRGIKAEYIVISNDYAPKMAKGGAVKRGDMSQHLAPNGKPSNLTHEQWHMVRTPEFKAWFGDWENDPENASKILDKNGEPLICYHSTQNDFNVFKEAKNTIGVYGKGFYFGNSKGYVSVYNRGENQKIIPVFLKIINPIIIQNYKHFGEDIVLPIGYEIYSDMMGGYDSQGYPLAASKGSSASFTTKAKSQNYDGVIAEIGYRDKEFVAFYPNQIKLADGSNTTFDGGNPDIRYARGGGVGGKKKTDMGDCYFVAGRKKIKEYKDGKETKDVVSFDRDDLYANGGVMAKGGTIEEQLEKINVYNDLDAYEYDQYKKFTDNGMPKVDALKVIINDVEGDTSQLSKKLASIAKKIKYSDGGMTEPELPHRYKIGDEVSFMKSDYSSDSGKIVGMRIGYMNKKGHNIYDVELKNGKFTVIAEYDILDDYSKNRKFYNPD